MRVAEKPVSPGFMLCSAFAHKGSKGNLSYYWALGSFISLRELIVRHCRLLGGGGAGFWVLSSISFLEIQAWSSVLWQVSVLRLFHPIWLGC